MFAVPLKDIVRIHSTSGTTGKPVVVGYTANDIAVWASLIARVLRAADVTEHDLVQIAFNYNLSSAGLGFHYGAEKIGSSVVPVLGRERRPPGDGHARLQDHRPRRHAQLRPAHRGLPARAGHPPRRAAPARGPLRRRELERGDARRDRARPRTQGLRQLRPHRAHRPRRGLRVLRARRPPRQRGPLHHGGGRSARR